MTSSSGHDFANGAEPQDERAAPEGVQEELRASEARAHGIIDTALDAVLLMNAGGRITGWNPAAERIFGWTRQEVLGLELADHIIPPRMREAHRAGLAAYLATGSGPVIGRRLELTAVRRDGAEFAVELAVNRLPGPGPAIFVGFIRDISQRKAVEAELAERVRLASLRADVAALLATSRRRSADPASVLRPARAASRRRLCPRVDHRGGGRGPAPERERRALHPPRRAARPRSRRPVQDRPHRPKPPGPPHE